MRSSKTDDMKLWILRNIRDGILRPGDKLGSVRELCDFYNVCRDTVTKTLAELKTDGVIEVSHGKTARIRERPNRRILFLYAYQESILFSPFLKPFYDGAYEVFSNAGVEFDICNTAFHNASEIRKMLLSPAYSGIFSLCGDRFFHHFSLDGLLESIPTVQIFGEANKNSIRFDYAPAFRSLVNAFSMRTNRILYVDTGARTLQKVLNNPKFQAFSASYTEAFGKPFPKSDILIFETEASDEICDGIRKKLKEKSKNPPGIFLSTDRFSMTAIRASLDCGLRCPENVLIAGCDNLADSRTSVPRLTTIELHREEVSRRGASMLLRLICEHVDSFPTESIASTPVFRESLPENHKEILK